MADTGPLIGRKMSNYYGAAKYVPNADLAVECIHCHRAFPRMYQLESGLIVCRPNVCRPRTRHM